MRLGTFDFGESEFSVKNPEKPQDAGKLEAADLPERIGNSDVEKLREAGRLEAMGLPEKIDVPPSIEAKNRIDDLTNKEKQDIANQVARRYNEKYYPYERAQQKGYTDVIQTENGGVSFEESEALYVTEDGTSGIVVIEATGSRTKDFSLANEALGLKDTPDGYVWHHVDDYDVKTNCLTLQLVKDEAHHASKPHLGACAQYDAVNGPSYNPTRKDMPNV